MTLAPPRRSVRGVGESVARPDGVPKVIGAFAYASDLRMEGMLHGQTLRSPHPHARIVRIDVTAARALPGVHAVLTAADLPTAVQFGLIKKDQPVLATGTVRYVGEPIALVASDHPEIGRAALAAIRVEYAALPSLHDPIAAIRPDAPPIHATGNVIDVSTSSTVIPPRPATSRWKASTRSGCRIRRPSVLRPASRSRMTMAR